MLAQLKRSAGTSEVLHKRAMGWTQLSVRTWHQPGIYNSQVDAAGQIRSAGLKRQLRQPAGSDCRRWQGDHQRSRTGLRIWF